MKKNKGGRPKKEIDQKQFENLCGLQCTKEEICGFFNIADKTLDRWCSDTYKSSFYEVFKQKRSLGHISLRRHQMKLAEKNANMAIFLGKNYLGQRDTPEVEINAGQLDALNLIVNAIQGNDDAD